MAFILALDQGTTSSRALVFDEAGRVRALAQREFTQHFPQPGWVEHDPEEIWQTQAQVAVEAVQKAGLTGVDIRAIGIANQRETTLVWDRATGRPIHRAIVWQDRRTADACDRLRARGVEGLIQRKTGLVVDPYFSGTKAAWLLDHVDGARERAERGELAFGTIDTWLAHRLTGGALHVTDASNASRTMLFDIHAGRWDDELCGGIGVPRAVLPEVRSSGEVLGEALAIPELEGVPIASLVGDQQAATFGQVCVEPGMAKNTYGTGCFLLMNTGDTARASQNRLLSTVAWRRDDATSYALEGAVFVGGAAVQWLRDGLGVIDQAPDIEALANEAPDSGGLYFVPALAGLGSPHWDPHAAGTIVGITRGTTRAHLARATLDAIAHQVADLVEAMSADAGAPLSELRVDGGAAANDLLMQTQADLLGVPVVRPETLETTALGAAYLAGLAVGYWGGVEQIAANWKADRRFEPRRSPDDVKCARERWRDAVARALGWGRGAVDAS